MQSKQKFGFKVLSVILMLSLLLVPLGASAAGQGYSDVFRVYSLTGIDNNPSIAAVALMYGSKTGDTSQNYVFVEYYNTKTTYLNQDVLSEAEFQKVLDRTISITQTDINNLNEYLLSEGVPDWYLGLDEKPKVVSEIQSAINSGKKSVTLGNNVVVFPDALKLAAQAGGSNFVMNFDTVDKKKVSVRLTVNPSQTTKGFSTIAWTGMSDFSKEIVSKSYKNKFGSIVFTQGGSFGTTVKVAAEVNGIGLKGMDVNNLKFYSFNSVKYTLTPLNIKDYSIKDGYLYFTTTQGGMILITDKPLTRK